MSFEKLSYEKIKKINWFVADTIRDKGDGDSSDYKKVTLPLITFKRFLDMREEFKRNEIYNSSDYEFEDNDLLEVLPIFMNTHKTYKVDDEHLKWYDIEWSDISNFPENPDRKNIEYRLGNGEKDRLTIQTNAANKIEFMFRVIETFNDSVTLNYFKRNEFEKTITKVLKNDYIEEIITELSKHKFDIEHAPEDLFGDAYMDLMGRFAAEEGKGGGEFFTPSNLVENSMKFARPHFKNNKVINIGDLTAGACTFMVYAAKDLEGQIQKENDKNPENKKDPKHEVNHKAQFITQEKTGTSELLGTMNMKLHGYDNHISYHGNTITDWKNGFIGDHEGEIDFMYANPPYGLKDYGYEYANDNSSKESRWKWGVPKKGEGEYAFISSIMNLLTEDGKAVIVLPLGILFKDSTQKIRQHFIENDWIEGVINMPSNMFYTTGIPVCLWVINKNKDEQDKKKIFMINADNDFTKAGTINEWEHEKSVLNYEKRTIEEGYSEYVTLETLKENDFNLSVSRYVYKEEEMEEIDIKALNNEINTLYDEINEYKELTKGLFDGAEE
jgi:type I restriction enzyme M protein